MGVSIGPRECPRHNISSGVPITRLAVSPEGHNYKAKYASLLIFFSMSDPKNFYGMTDPMKSFGKTDPTTFCSMSVFYIGNDASSFAAVENFNLMSVPEVPT